MGAPERTASALTIRLAAEADLGAIAALDGKTSGLPKPHYWRDLFERFQTRREGRVILVAESDDALVGFMVGEIRAWEFGSPPCGWIFALAVDPDCREGGLGSGLFDAACDFFRQNGVAKVRTMLRRDDSLVMSFFRSQGMMAGPFVQLEKDLDQ